MSSTTFGQKGIDAVQRKDYAAAIPLLDKALKDSKSPKWLLARAQAHQQLKNWDDALHDAETAYHSAIERGSGDSRKLMIEAQYRRAAIYFKLGRYADSDCCAKWSMLLAEGRRAGEDDGVDKNVDSEGHYTVTYADGVADKEGQPGQNGGGIGGQVNALVTTPKTGFEADWNRAYAFRSQALGALKQLSADHPGRKVMVTKVPPKTQKKKAPEPVESDSDDDLPASKAANKPEPSAPGSVPDEKMKLRADFYQTNQNITISLFAKDLNKEDIQVQFTKTTARISAIPREVAPYVKPGDREATSTLVFGGEIVPSGSRWSATPRKIELVLQKATPGKWSGWGEEKIGAQDPETAEVESSGPSGTHETPKDAVSADLEKIVTSLASVAPPKQASAPVYPTSSKLGPKDWDKLGEGEDDDDDKQDVNHFFKQLYKGSSPEQQRAMMKSFIESNGTALSTDWNDVKSRTVESVPPDGVEAKKWES
ncbi:SGS domain-containing protein [Lasiosphaeria ovina]|uniref:SGS domain-containing protein n=1 Tax=Lasiosphaeria ovina TaxID=92902 RepID=A0AAE0KE25_9PEZI|nr:SGS domain-containing protein [Lasiosphaeria ovina]